jgi:signal peptidase II
MLLTLTLYTAADLGTKEWALESLSEPVASEHRTPVCEPTAQGYTFDQRRRTGNVVIIEEVLEFRYAENCGAAFSMLRTAPTWLRVAVFGVAATAACLGLCWMFFRGGGGPLFAAGVPFILSGAIGNLVDRIRHGYVVDFILVHVTDTYDWPIFNVADIAIAIGAGLTLFDGRRRARSQGKG